MSNNDQKNHESYGNDLVIYKKKLMLTEVLFRQCVMRERSSTGRAN